MAKVSDEQIRHILLDYDGVFTKDNYDPVFEALMASTTAFGSPQTREQINTAFDKIEWKHVLTPESQPFLDEVRETFHYRGTDDELRRILNDRGDTKFIDVLPRFLEAGITLSVLSNQIAYRISYVRKHLDKFGLKKFERVYFSPEVGLQKPFVGIAHDTAEVRDISEVDIFPLVVKDLRTDGHTPEGTVFIDDSKENIASAKAHGIKGIVYETTAQVLEELDREYGLKI